MRRDLQRRLFERLRVRPLPVDQHARPLGLDFAVLTAAVVAGVAAAPALLGGWPGDSLTSSVLEEEDCRARQHERTAMPTVHFPDVRRPDAGTALVSQWIVSAPELQHKAADLLIAEWERQDDRPDAMLSLTAFLSEDGLRILFYAQWTDDDAHRAWARTRRPATVSRIDEELPGIQRPGLVRYALGRSHLPADAAGRNPGLLVTPAFRTDGPATQRRLAGTVLAILEEEQVPGLLGAHFHLSKDGEQVLNFAEWEDEQQWRRFAEHSAAPRLRAALESIEGVTFLNTFGNAARYRPYASLVNVEPPVR